MCDKVMTHNVADGVMIGPAIPLAGEPLPLELVNTTFVDGGRRGRVVDALGTPVELDRWLHGHAAEFDPDIREGLSRARATPAQLETYLRLRAALRGALACLTTGQPPTTGDLDVINTNSRNNAHWTEVVTGTPPRSVSRWCLEDWVMVAAGAIAAAGVELLAGPQGDRLRACPAAGCVLYFVKTHPRREWCGPVCGNRARVARYGQRRRGDT